MSTQSGTTTNVMYFAHPNTGDRDVSDAIVARGLNFLRAPPSAVHAIGLCHQKQPAYGSYVDNLPSFIQAFWKRTRVPTNKAGYPVNTPNDKLIPLRNPPLIINFSTPLTPANVAFMSSVGYYEVKVGNRKEAFVFENTTYADIVKIKEMKANDLTPSYKNSVNLNAMRSWYLVMKIISGFLSMHTYPAFRDDDEMDYHDQEKYLVKKRSAVGYEKRMIKKVKTMDIDDETQDVEEEEEEDLSVEIERLSIMLQYAKPQRNDVKGWGTTTDLPNEPGILCPFVPELASFDKDTVPSLIERYFLMCLGSSTTAILDKIHEVRAAWGLLSQTDAGNAMSHICKCISIALECQARVFPIFSNGQYEGSVITGTKFTVGIQKARYVPGTYEQLQSLVASSSLHSVNLKKISTLVGGEYGELILAAGCMREISTIVCKAPLTEEVKADISRAASHLNFPQKYWSINPTRIIEMLSHIRGSSAIPIDAPLHPSCLFDNRLTASALACFGIHAPTFLIPNTKSFKVVKGSNSPKTFAVRSVRLATAIQDIESVLKNKSITNDPANLAKKHQDFTLKGAEKTNVWKSLISVCDTVAAVVEVEGEVVEEEGEEEIDLGF